MDQESCSIGHDHHKDCNHNMFSNDFTWLFVLIFGNPVAQVTKCQQSPNSAYYDRYRKICNKENGYREGQCEEKLCKKGRERGFSYFLLTCSPCSFLRDVYPQSVRQ